MEIAVAVTAMDDRPPRAELQAHAAVALESEGNARGLDTLARSTDALITRLAEPARDRATASVGLRAAFRRAVLGGFAAADVGRTAAATGFRSAAGAAGHGFATAVGDRPAVFECAGVAGAAAADVGGACAATH